LACVLYFTRDYSPHDHRFLTALARTDHQVYFLPLEGRRNRGEDRPIPYGIEHLSLHGSSEPPGPADYPRLWAGLKRVIRETRPDLVHAGPIQSCAFLTALAGYRPLVSMSWGYDLLMDANKSRLYGWMTRYTLTRTAVMVADCQPVRDAAVRFGMAADRIIIFPWGVDLEAFRPADPGRTEDREFILLSTRSWESVYGVDVLAKAFIKASREREGLRLILLGSGSQAGLLRSIFLQGGVSEKVDFRGLVPQADLPRYYQMADLYVSASHVDGSSVSLMEALASGKPVLVTDLPGNREWIQPGVQGWLFPDGDVESLAKAIVKAFDRRRELRDMGRAARKLAERKADWEVNFQKLLQAYDLALQVRT